MQKRTREILALVLLGVFALASVGAMGYYILVGHNWNVTASNIDDSIGQMEGYSVILYEGTRPSDSHPSQRESRSMKSESQIASDEVSSSSSSPLAENDEEPTDINAVAARYREKGAAVFVVDVENLSRYSDPFIAAKSGKRIGFLAAARTKLRSAIRNDARSLHLSGADFIVAVTDDPALSRVASDDLIGDVSIIIFDDQKGRTPNGDYLGSTYCVSTPEVGEVGAVIISPSGVFSTKLVDGVSES